MLSNSKIKTRPPIEPVGLEDMRRQMGISQEDDTTRDAIIKSRIVSARRWCEQYTRRAFITQTWVTYADCFRNSFDLIPDLLSLVSVNYLDTEGEQQTLTAENYLADTVNSRLYPAYQQDWPSVRQQVNAVAIEYVCGYGLPHAVPEDIKDAIKFIVGHWENYQSSTEGGDIIRTIPYAVTQLLQPYVDMRNHF